MLVVAMERLVFCYRGIVHALRVGGVVETVSVELGILMPVISSDVMASSSDSNVSVIFYTFSWTASRRSIEVWECRF